MKRFTFILLLSLIAAIALSGCGADNALDTASPTHSPEASPTHIPSPTSLSSVTPTSEPTVTPEPTMAPTPIGAGLVTPQFEVHFDTPLENLEPGEYLLVEDVEYHERTGGARYRYSSWDGSKVGVLFSLTSTAGQVFSAFLNGIIDNQLWFGTFEDPNIYMVDLLMGETLQFTTGTNCIFSRRFGVRDDKFIYRCREDPEHRGSYYIVSLPDWEIIGSPPVPEKMGFIGWINSDTAEYSTGWESSKNEFPYCLAQAPFWELDCRMLPFDVDLISPDGEWRWVRLS